MELTNLEGLYGTILDRLEYKVPALKFLGDGGLRRLFNDLGSEEKNERVTAAKLLALLTWDCPKNQRKVAEHNGFDLKLLSGVKVRVFSVSRKFYDSYERHYAAARRPGQGSPVKEEELRPNMLEFVSFLRSVLKPHEIWNGGMFPEELLPPYFVYPKPKARALDEFPDPRDFILGFYYVKNREVIRSRPKSSVPRSLNYPTKSFKDPTPRHKNYLRDYRLTKFPQQILDDIDQVAIHKRENRRLQVKRRKPKKSARKVLDMEYEEGSSTHSAETQSSMEGSEDDDDVPPPLTTLELRSPEAYDMLAAIAADIARSPKKKEIAQWSDDDDVFFPVTSRQPQPPKASRPTSASTYKSRATVAKDGSFEGFVPRNGRPQTAARSRNSARRGRAQQKDRVPKPPSGPRMGVKSVRHDIHGAGVPNKGKQVSKQSSRGPSSERTSAHGSKSALSVQEAMDFLVDLDSEGRSENAASNVRAGAAECAENHGKGGVGDVVSDIDTTKSKERQYSNSHTRNDVPIISASSEDVNSHGENVNSKRENSGNENEEATKDVVEKQEEEELPDLNTFTKKDVSILAGMQASFKSKFARKNANLGKVELEKDSDNAPNSSASALSQVNRDEALKVLGKTELPENNSSKNPEPLNSREPGNLTEAERKEREESVAKLLEEYDKKKKVRSGLVDIVDRKGKEEESANADLSTISEGDGENGSPAKARGKSEGTDASVTPADPMAALLGDFGGLKKSKKTSSNSDRKDSIAAVADPSAAADPMAALLGDYSGLKKSEKKSTKGETLDSSSATPNPMTALLGDYSGLKKTPNGEGAKSTGNNGDGSAAVLDPVSSSSEAPNGLATSSNQEKYKDIATAQDPMGALLGDYSKLKRKPTESSGLEEIYDDDFQSSVDLDDTGVSDGEVASKPAPLSVEGALAFLDSLDDAPADLDKPVDVIAPVPDETPQAQLPSNDRKDSKKSRKPSAAKAEPKERSLLYSVLDKQEELEQAERDMLAKTALVKLDPTLRQKGPSNTDTSGEKLTMQLTPSAVASHNWQNYGVKKRLTEATTEIEETPYEDDFEDITDDIPEPPSASVYNSPYKLNDGEERVDVPDLVYDFQNQYFKRKPWDSDLDDELGDQNAVAVEGAFADATKKIYGIEETKKSVHEIDIDYEKKQPVFVTKPGRINAGTGDYSLAQGF